jgi:putative redox protein
MQAKATWNQGLSFTGTGSRGVQLPLGADPEAGAAAQGFGPMELVAIGLAGCTGMDVISILQKKRQQVTAFEVAVHAEQAAEHPHVFTRAVVTYRVTGHAVDEQAVLRAIELSVTKYCPVQAMLRKAFPMELKYEVYEDGGEKDQPVRQGQFRLQSS